MLATIAAVTVAVIVILAALWYMRRKMREDFDEATEHIDSGDPDAAHVKGSSSIPIRARASGLSMTAKVMFGAIGGIILIVGLFAFETIRTGSPAEVMFADQLITGAQVAAGVVVGIVGVNMAQKSVGWHHVVYETESGDVQTESVPINVSGMEADTEGNAVVSEYARTRVLGLFRRTKHVAEDATLDGTHRAPGKPIKHQIPSTRSRSARTSGSRGRPNRRRLRARTWRRIMCTARRSSYILRQVRRYERIEPPKGHSTHVAGVDRRGPRKRT